MKRLRSRRKPLLAIAAVLASVALLAVALNGYRIAGDKHTDEELAAEYDVGYDAGYDSGELDGEEQGEDNLRRLRGKSYWRGWDEGQTLGAKLAAPDEVDFYENYIVTYEPSSNGPTLHNWLEMPLGTTWRCDDFESCNELTDPP